MKISEMFKVSARELKNLRCLTTAGILSALYIVLNAYVIIPLGDARVTFGYLALAVIAMLYGPAVSVIAAVPCDILAAMLGPYALNLAWTPNRMLEGLIYGVFLYGLTKINDKNSLKKKVFFSVKIIISRLIVVILCYFVINSFLIYFITSPPSTADKTFWVWAVGRAAVKDIIQYPIDMALMFTLLPAAGIAYNKVNAGFGKERRSI